VVVSSVAIRPALPRGRAEEGNWGKRELTGGSQPLATEARAQQRGTVQVWAGHGENDHDDFSILNSFSN
jgi:hypothetical protein